MPWIQYDVSTGLQAASNSMQVSDEALADQGRAQIFLGEEAEDPHFWNVDVSQTPHVLVYSPPPSPPVCLSCGYVGVYGNFCPQCGAPVTKG